MASVSSSISARAIGRKRRGIERRRQRDDAIGQRVRGEVDLASERCVLAKDQSPGRIRQQSNTAGGEIWSEAAEQAILRCEGVKECVVIGVPDAKWGEVGRAYVVPAELEPEAILTHLDGQIARSAKD